MAGCASAFALHLLAVSARTTAVDPASFFAVASRAVPRATFFIDASVAIKCFGVQSGFLVVIGDLVPAAIHTLGGPGHLGFVYDRRFWSVRMERCARVAGPGW
jgi:amino acid permease